MKTLMKILGKCSWGVILTIVALMMLAQVINILVGLVSCLVVLLVSAEWAAA